VSALITLAADEARFVSACARGVVEIVFILLVGL